MNATPDWDDHSGAGSPAPEFPDQAVLPTVTGDGRKLFRTTVVVIACGLLVGTAFSYVLGIVTFGTLPGTLVPGPATSTTSWLEPVKVALTVAAGIGGAVALVVAYRKQQLAEVLELHRKAVIEPREHAAELRAQSAADREVDRLYRDRYAAAAEQLGHDNPTVRLAGVYGLANLADTWEEQRQQCVDVLCAHLRIPWDASPEGALARVQIERAIPVEEGGGTRTLSYPSHFGENEVRKTILRAIGSHLLPDGARPAGQVSWSTLALDFTGATLPDLKWDGTRIPRTSFRRASFVGAARFGRASFESIVDFEGATFAEDAGFGKTRFRGITEFESVTFGRAAIFEEAKFMAAALFSTATFSGPARFRRAVFNEDAWFGGATFKGMAWFAQTMFNAETDFDRSTFEAKTTFRGTKFCGSAEFNAANFREDVLFLGASFELPVGFEGTSFGGAVSFGKATLDGEPYRPAGAPST